MFEPGPATGTLDTASGTEEARRISAMSEGMSGSEILRIAAEIRAMTEAGQRVCNLTVGDFSPAEFRIPKFLENEVAEALRRGETNYPPSNGVAPLREAISRFYKRMLGLDYPASSVLVTSGGILCGRHPCSFFATTAACCPLSFRGHPRSDRRTR